MAEVAGKGGSLTFAGLTAGVEAWTLDIVGDALEVTDFSDAGIRTFIAGCSSWSGSCEANWDAGNTVAVLDTGTITLTVAAGEAYSGTVFITGISVNTVFEGVVEASITFQGSGTLTPA